MALDFWPQNDERTNVCCFKAPGCGTLCQQPQGTEPLCTPPKEASPQPALTDRLAATQGLPVGLPVGLLPSAVAWGLVSTFSSPSSPSLRGSGWFSGAHRRQNVPTVPV